MPRIERPFRVLAPGDLARPYLDIKVINPFTGNEIVVFGLVDTGADECAFPGRYAVLLGHSFEQGAIKHIDTGNGQTVAYGHTVRIEVGGVSTENVVLDFMPNLRVPLLGTRSFLSRFILTVDYPKRIVSLTY